MSQVERDRASELMSQLFDLLASAESAKESERQKVRHVVYLRDVEDNIRHRGVIEEQNAAETENVAKERASVGEHRAACLVEERRSNDLKERIAVALEKIAGSATTPGEDKP